MIPQEIVTERLLLNQPRPSDVQMMTEYCQDPIFKKFLPLPWPYRTEHAEYYINELVPESWANGSEVNWAIRDLTDPDGLLGVVGVRKELGAVGYWLGGEHRGRGILPEALKAALDWVIANEFLRADQISWSCFAGNTASVQVARKTGFQFRGVEESLAPAGDGTFPATWTADYVDHRSTDHLASWPPFTLEPEQP